MIRTALAIAGVRFPLRIFGPFDVARFRHRFAPYEIDAAGVGALPGLTLWNEPHGKLLAPDAPPYPAVKAYVTDGGIKMLRAGLAMFVAADGAADAFLRGPEKYPPLSHEEDAGVADTPIRLFVTHALLASGRGALVHACGHAGPHGAILFAGASGAGKTTLARALPADGVLSDDQVAILTATADDRVALAATPFVGIYGRVSPPRSAPLRAVVLLDRTEPGALVRLDASDAARSLLACTPLYTRTPACAAALLATVARVVEATPVLRGSPDLREGIAPWLARIASLSVRPDT
jgi:hypothetical protein